jgi:acetyl-CoA carboxylase alpha subunit
MISQVKSYLKNTITELSKFTEKELIQKRRDKFLEIGQNL